MSDYFHFYLHGHARDAQHFQELLTALRTFGFDVVAAYTAATVQPVPPIVAVPPPANHNFAPRTHQKVIDLFSNEFGVGYWAIIERAGLAYMATLRAATYLGPDVEDLPLTDDEKARLIATL